MGSLGSELLLGGTRSSILLNGVFTVRPLCKPLLLICRDLCTRNPSFRRDHARELPTRLACAPNEEANQVARIL